MADNIWFAGPRWPPSTQSPVQNESDAQPFRLCGTVSQNQVGTMPPPRDKPSDGGGTHAATRIRSQNAQRRAGIGTAGRCVEGYDSGALHLVGSNDETTW